MSEDNRDSADELASLPPLREVVRAFDLGAKKSLGQNFLFDLNLTGRIARAAGPLDNATVIEIGPGPGGLTRALLAEGARLVLALERDERCLPALAEIERACPGRLRVIAGDALSMDYHALAQQAAPGSIVRIAANLPYNIATPLLVNWIGTTQWPPFYDRLTLMFQREVALRIVATPRERADYGRLAVLAGWRTQARILFDISPSAFTPPPKVTSSVVELVPRENPLPCDAAMLELVTRLAFGQRRKMLRQSLKQIVDGDASRLNAMLDVAQIDGTQRAEEIDVEGFVRLANAASAMRS
jgi:16S rRNA (adenine1518-N6/adenine1519-N6)-dimethyltransferase